MKTTIIVVIVDLSWKSLSVLKVLYLFYLLRVRLTKCKHPRLTLVPGSWPETDAVRPLSACYSLIIFFFWCFPCNKNPFLNLIHCKTNNKCLYTFLVPFCNIPAMSCFCYFLKNLTVGVHWQEIPLLQLPPVWIGQLYILQTALSHCDLMKTYPSRNVVTSCKIKGFIPIPKSPSVLWIFEQVW